MDFTRTSRATALAIALAASCSSARLIAADSNDADAIAAIYSPILDRSGESTSPNQPRSQTPTERFETLARWVMPATAVQPIRCDVSFSPRDQYRLISLPDESPRFNIDPGGTIESPVKELIELATQLDRLPELLKRIESLQPSSDRHQLDHLAMLAMIQVAMIQGGTIQGGASGGQGASGPRLTSAEQAVQRWVAQALLTPPENLPRASTILAMESALTTPATTDLVAPLVSATRNHFRKAGDLDAWGRHLGALQFRVESSVEDLSENIYWSTDQHLPSGIQPQNDPHWIATSRYTSAARGGGYPASVWKRDGDHILNRVSFDDDYLIYRTPLVGEVAIEADITSFGFRDSALMIGGSFLQPRYDFHSAHVGSVRGDVGTVQFPAPLKNQDFLRDFHDRMVVRDHTMTTYLDGRKVHQQPAPADGFPFVGLRSDHRRNGGGDDIRISGGSVPTQIDLVNNPQLPGWHDYHAVEPSKELKDWHFVDGELVSHRDPDAVQGSDQLRVLQYVRPVLEDGEIEYQFFYQTDVANVAPVLDRVSWWLHPDHVEIRVIDDSIHAPPAQTPIAVTQPISENAMLRENNWNHARLRFQADEMVLFINDVMVMHFSIPAGCRRTFGFMHPADQTTARIRNVIWTSEWGETLKSSTMHALANATVTEIESGRPKLREVTREDLGLDSVDSGRFSVIHGSMGQQFVPVAGGLRIIRTGTGGYIHAELSPNLSIGGDFDVTIHASDIEFNPMPGFIHTLKLSMTASNPNRDHATASMKIDDKGQTIFQNLKMDTINGEQRRNYFGHRPAECNACALRLSRRADQIFFLYSFNDSNQFRLLGQSSFSTADIDLADLRFGLQAHGPGGVSEATLQSIEIACESNGIVVAEDETQLIVETNRRAAELPIAYEIDFAKQDVDAARLYRWSAAATGERSAKGLAFSSVGATQWSSAGISPNVGGNGDFDCRVDLGELDLQGSNDASKSAVMLQMLLADSLDTELNLAIEQDLSGQRSTFVQLRQTNRPGEKPDYRRIASMRVGLVTSLRIVRNGDQIHFMASSPEFLQRDGAETRVVATIRMDEDRVPYHGIKLLLHTSDPAATSNIVVRRMSVRFETPTALRTLVNPTIAPPAKSKTNTPQPSGISKFFNDLFNN